MKRVAVFGNAGGGKSTLSRELAVITGLPLHVIDEVRFPDGKELPPGEYRQIHATLLTGDAWIIDGFDNVTLTWDRFEAADTLIHVDLPLMVHAWWITKRLAKGLFVAPAGWPDKAPVLASSLSSYRVLWPCHRHLTPKYRTYLAEVAERKRVVHLRSPGELKRFLASTRNQARPAQGKPGIPT
jgi:adenylate kinase family enzyme